jgi:hypothetical protein
LAGQSFASQVAMLKMLEMSKGATPDRTAPAAGANVAPSPATPEGSGEFGQVCIKEHRTKQIMCGEPVR